MRPVSPDTSDLIVLPTPRTPFSGVKWDEDVENGESTSEEVPRVADPQSVYLTQGSIAKISTCSRRSNHRGEKRGIMDLHMSWNLVFALG